MNSKITAANSKLADLQGRHAAATVSAKTTLDDAIQAKSNAYDALLHARASGSADVSKLHAAHDKATSALNAAQLDADTQRTIAAQLEPQIEAAKAELSEVQAEHLSATLETVRDAERVAELRRAKAFDELFEAHVAVVAAHNRATALQFRKMGQELSAHHLIHVVSSWNIGSYNGLTGDVGFYKAFDVPVNQAIIERINSEIAAIGN